MKFLFYTYQINFILNISDDLFDFNRKILQLNLIYKILSYNHIYRTCKN